MWQEVNHWKFDLKKKIRGHIFPFLLYLFFYFSLCIGFCYQNLVFIFDWFFFQPDSKYHNSVDLFILVRWLCSIKSWHFLQRQWRNENEYGKTLYLLFLKHARSNISRQLKHISKEKIYILCWLFYVYLWQWALCW